MAARGLHSVQRRGLDQDACSLDFESSRRNKKKEIRKLAQLLEECTGTRRRGGNEDCRKFKVMQLETDGQLLLPPPTSAICTFHP